MRLKFCFWSVSDGAYGAMMEHCVRSARQAGVFKEFHVLTDRPLEGCECYDAYHFDKEHGLFKLHYLKVGMSRLNFDYFIWLDADTMFMRNPLDLLGPLGKSPIHVPLEFNLSPMSEDLLWKGVSLFQVRELMRCEGKMDQVYMGQSAFWMVHHDVIDTVYEVALGFWHSAKKAGATVYVSAALGYAMQLICANPERHLVRNHSNIWVSDDDGHFRRQLPDGAPWVWRQKFGPEEVEVRPSIIHLPNSKELLGASQIHS